MFRIIGLVLGSLVLGVCLQGCSKDEIGTSSCPPGAFRCTEDGAETCDFNGAGWIETPCAQGDICVPGQCDDPAECPDECQPKVCEPGTSVCGADHLYVYQCDNTGTELCYSHSCSDPPLDGVCFNGECVAVCDEGQKSYLGCEYFAVDLDNADVFCGYDEFGNIVYCDAADSQYAVVLSNPNVTDSAYVMIMKGALDAPPPSATCSQPDLPENYVDAAVIPPKGIKIFELPSRNVNGTIIDKLAYRIVSNIPVTAYQFNPLENVDVFSNDASVLLPTTTASQDFLVMTREQTFDELKGFLTVVGIDDEPTLVGVTVTTRTLPGPNIPALQPGEQFTATLNKYDVLNIETNFIGGDLTGSRVQADRGVLVFGGSEAANTPNTSRCDLTTNTCEQDSSIACGCTPEDGANCSPHAPCATPELITCCADHLEQQMFPTSTWGTDYIAIRSYPRGNELDAWRVMAAEDNTEVTFNPAVNEPLTLNRGQWHEFETNEDFFVNATKPVLVGQFLAAEQAPNPGRAEGDAGIGDPAFILAVPVRQFRDSYVFLAPDKYERDYVSVAIKKGTAALLDGTSIVDLPAALTSDLVGGEWQAVRVPISDGFHTLSCTETCSVMVHGYDSYVSYGYPGGLNLDDL